MQNFCAKSRNFAVEFVQLNVHRAILRENSSILLREKCSPGFIQQELIVEEIKTKHTFKLIISVAVYCLLYYVTRRTIYNGLETTIQYFIV